jgi:hypothetical protein
MGSKAEKKSEAASQKKQDDARGDGRVMGPDQQGYGFCHIY